MRVETKPTFRKDYKRIRNSILIQALLKKIEQLENAKTTGNITGLKQLRGYVTQYRIIVKSDKHSYRIGAIIRGNTIWLVRFLPHKKIYQEFP